VFFDALALHCEIIVPKDFSPSASTQRLLLTDREMEFRLLAQWAKKQWRAHPQHSIGCIIPDLLSDRATVERIFREEFKEDLRDAVNIAGGDTLLSFPIIHTALTLIELMSGRALLQPQLTALLLSPYLQDGIVEGQQRALLDRRLRRSHEDAFNLTSFILQIKDLPLCPQLQHLFHSAIKIFSPKIKFGYALSEQSDEFVGEGVWSELIELLESERDSNTSINSDLTPSKWAILFTEILTHFGWPGDRPLESSEFQCVKSFQQQLRHYAGLDWLLNEQTLREASETFRQLLSNALFQPESNQRARIHVLGLLEASGLHFDQLWITNMNDDTWPRPPSPNPFIPIHWQRELAMPRSSGSHELHYAQQIMQRLQHSTSQLIASYSLQKHDEHRELAPSPLILDFIETTLSELQLEAPQALTANPPLEDWQDDKAPRIEQNENVRGGATILQRQAECPFRAFAEIRLQAKPFDEVELGLSAAERGSLVHAVMAELWRRLGDSQHLQQFSAEKLNLFVRESVRDVVLEVLPLPDDLNKHLCELEIQRLHQLVLQWLDLEQQRPPFKVTAIEQPIELKIAELSLHLQVDRIDTLEDGSQIIIDYKTGSPSPSSWFGERPDEPQLPLYALHAPEHIRGLVFAQIRAQIVKFNGITAETGKLPGVKSVQTPWPELIEQWQTTLTNLAENFCAGEASVAPKKYPTTCTYCHLASLCRINERESD
jgi:ATP-dependent helicase/nuclease subunit B